MLFTGRSIRLAVRAYSLSLDVNHLQSGHVSLLQGGACIEWKIQVSGWVLFIKRCLQKHWALQDRKQVYREGRRVCVPIWVRFFSIQQLYLILTISYALVFLHIYLSTSAFFNPQSLETQEDRYYHLPFSVS